MKRSTKKQATPEVKSRRLGVIKSLAREHEELRKRGLKKITPIQREALERVFSTIDAAFKNNSHNYLLPENAGESANGTPPGGAEKSDNARISKIFELFISELLQRNGSPKQTDLGTSTWSAAPVEDIVTDGLWAVMLSLSKKYNLPMATEYQVLEQMAPMVDAMVSLALSILYRDTESAADDFEKEVMGGLKQNISIQQDGEELLPQNLWQLPAARFFAGLIANSREQIKKALNEASGLARFNVANPNGPVTFLPQFTGSGSAAVGELKRALAFLEGPSYAKSGDFHKSETAVLSALENLKTDRREATDIHLLRRLPYRLENLPSADDPGNINASVDRLNTSISETWLNTQILLAATGAKAENEFVDEKEFIEGTAAVKKLPAEKMLQRMLARLHTRGMRMDGSDLNELKYLLKDRIASIREQDFQMEMMEDTYYLTSRFFIAFRTDRAPAISYESIDWNSITLKRLKQLIANEVLTPFNLARGICRMPAKIQKKAAAFLMENSAFIGIEGLILFCQHDLIDFSHPVLRRNITRLPLDWLKKYVFELLDNPEMQLEDPALFLKAINLMDENEAAEILNLPERRLALLTLVFRFSSPMLRKMENVSDGDFENLLRRLGAETWKKLVLSSMVLERSDDYKKPIKENDEILVPWPELCRDQYFLEMIGNPPETEAKKILQDYPEDEIFKWINVNDPGVESGLKEYSSSRNAYYRQLAAERKPGK